MLTKDQFVAVLHETGTLVIDGALATELEQRGHDLKHPLWSAKVLNDEPSAIQKVHEDYYLVGANIAITASYQASIPGLADHFSMDESEALALIKKSVALATQARTAAYVAGVPQSRKLLVAGSVGPYGAYLADGSEYRGDYIRTEEEFVEFHAPRIKALVEAGVDLLAIETMPSIREIEAVLKLLRNEHPFVCAWLGCTLRDGHHLSDGTPLSDLVKIITPYQDQLVAIGVNCVPSDIVSDALRTIALALDSNPVIKHVALMCYPNSGESWDAVEKVWHSESSKNRNLASMTSHFRACGATLIGGCCRTGPGDIKLIAQTLSANAST